MKHIVYNVKQSPDSNMKAIVYNSYGSPGVLQLQEIEKPVPKENEILVRVKAVPVNYGDILARNFKNISLNEFHMPLLLWVFARLAFGLNKPRIRVLGNSFSGEIESVGKKVNRFGKGDAVFGYTGEKMGAYAEYLCLPENALVALKPANLDFDEASALPYGSLMALCLLKKVDIQKEQTVLVTGASGGIGSAAVQLLKNHFGAKVSGVCSSKRMGYVKELGADTVFDYEKDDFMKIGKYDLIFDVPGKGCYSSYKSMLNKNGTCLYASFKTKKLLQMLWTGFAGDKKVVCALANPKADDLLLIKQLVEEGKLKSIIDTVFPLEQTARAHETIENKRNAGTVIIKT